LCADDVLLLRCISISLLFKDEKQKQKKEEFSPDGWRLPISQWDRARARLLVRENVILQFV
jgi:hypothetical protein